MMTASSRAQRLGALLSRLEDREMAAMAAAGARAHGFANRRAAVIGDNLRARRSLDARTMWTHFDAACLWAHTVWASSMASRFSAQQTVELRQLAERGAQRLRWARCRVGVERRARRERQGR